MPLKIIKVCRHCGEPIEQDDYFQDWFHTGRESSDIDMPCDPAKPTGLQATPTFAVEPPSHKGRKP